MKIKIGGGLIAFFVFILLGGHRLLDVTVMLPWLLAAITHEMGHYFTALILGVKIEKLTFDVLGARMTLGGGLISYEKEAVIAAMGPAVNLAAALLTYRTFPYFSAFSIMLGVLNLIPAPTFDGYCILVSLVAKFFGNCVAERIGGAFSFFAVIVMWLLAVYLLLVYRTGFSLFILSCALIGGAAKKRE